MWIYFAVIKYNFQRFLTYPLEIVSLVARKFIYVTFSVVFWNIIFANSSDPTLTKTYFLGYFLTSTGLSDIVMIDSQVLGKFIRREIKKGQVSNYLIKPVRLIPFLYATALGRDSMRFIIGLFMFFAGILILNPVSYLSLILLFYFILISFILGLFFNLLEASLAFIFTEVGGIKNAMRHIIRVFSGLLIPISFFPENIKNTLELLPFPYMIYGPINSLQINKLTSEVTQSIFISGFWAITLSILIIFIWKACLKSYEAVGI